MPEVADFVDELLDPAEVLHPERHRRVLRTARARSLR